MLAEDGRIGSVRNNKEGQFFVRLRPHVAEE
jgi:hypothetical protein